MPILKCFLGALFTYQITYYTWMKLENAEHTKDTEDEIAELKAQLKTLVQRKIEAEKQVQARQETGEQLKAEPSVKKGWL